MAIPQHPFRPDVVSNHVNQSGTPSAQDLYMAMSSAFAQYSEIVEVSTHDNEASRKRVLVLESECQSRGLCGQTIIQLLRAFHAQIGWERMVPDEFTRFYRFVFHLCKQPARKHVEVETALEAWRLLLALRFRLLDKWCDFIAMHKPAMKVISEDQWRQVLEFSRTVHEDLSNYDPNGAWSCFLDDFVEHLRCYCSRPGGGAGTTRALSSCMDELELHTLSHMDGGEPGMVMGVPMSPRLGSKRRSPDVDVVLERLSAIPLPSTATEDPMGVPQGVVPIITQTPGSAAKRHCPENPAFRQQLSQQQNSLNTALHPVDVPIGLMQQDSAQGMSCGGSSSVGGPMSIFNVGMGGLSPVDVPPQSPFTFELPMLQVSARRHIRPRRSNVSELVHSTVSELFLNE